jgi:hypothetical protein
MKKLIIIGCACAVLVTGWWVFQDLCEAQWQSNFQRHGGFFIRDGYRVEVQLDPAHYGEWKVAVVTPDGFGRWDCRGFKSNHEALESAWVVIDEHRDGGYDYNDWERN